MASCPYDCRGIRVSGVVTVSIVLGIVAAFLQFFGTITVGTTFIAAVLAAAVAYLAIALIVAGVSACCTALAPCACPLLATQLLGSIGSVLLSAVLLAIGTTAGIVGAILFGVLILAFALMLLSTATLAWQLSRCND